MSGRIRFVVYGVTRTLYCALRPTELGLEWRGLGLQLGSDG